ncbi:AraC family transcriptional regulator [Antribacter gilvus]|uniref:AraC family transcriptional regulator n=1 Tax=Antribacter gilvus TaxID=2304675 RepID=UPI000F797584|nr:AraC family transcriptional regulator [Antribacter gilvus]
MTPITGPATLVDSLDRALASIDWSLLESRRDALAQDERLDRDPGSTGLVYVARGSARISVGAERQELVADDLVFFPRAQRHTFWARTDLELNSVVFAPGARSRALDVLPASLLVRRFTEHEPNMTGLVHSIGCSLSGSTPGRRPGDTVVCGRIASAIVTAAVRSWSELGCAPDRWLHQVDDPYVAQALEALHRDLASAWTVEDLARVAAMSRSAFAERFRVVVGQSPASYLTSVRMDAGMELLAREGLTVAEAARRLGYESEAGFSRAFRRHTGSPPALWRRGASAPDLPPTPKHRATSPRAVERRFLPLRGGAEQEAAHQR